MTTTSVTLSGFVYDNAGNAVQDATVTAYTSADNATSANGLTDTTDANGRWDLTTTDETKYPMDVKVVFGSSTRWIKAANGINLTRLTVSGAAVFGENDTGVDVTMYGATSGRYLLWDESEDALHLNDSTELKIGTLAAGDMVLYHDGTNSYIKNATGALKIATESSGIAVTIGHTTSEVTVADNLTVTGNLTVSGTQTIVDTVTMNAANAIVFEGATADGYETTLTIEDPTADRTVVIPNVGGTLAVLAADSDTAITTTPAELNLIDGGTARGTTAIADGDGVLINDGGTMRMTTVETLATYLEGEIDAFSGRITADAGIDIDNITIDGTEIDLSSGDLTIDVAGDIVLDADGDDITFKAGSGDSTGLAFTNSSGSWTLKTGTSDADFTIAGNDGGSNVNALVFDMSDAGKATFAGNVVVTGDLTVSGDDLFMGTNTDAYMLIADGTNYNPVAISGDIAITNAGVTSIASNSIVNADVNSSAAIADSKLATISTADKVAGGAIQIDSGTDGTGITLADGDKFLVDDGGSTKYINASQLSSYITAEGSMSSFQLEDDSGDEVTINNANEIKFIGSGIDINWTDTDNGTDADPYDLTFTLDFSDLSTVTPADGDFFATLDSDGANEQKTTTTALATLFAGAGMTATSAVLNVIGGDGITANANDVAITPANTNITSIYNAALAVGYGASHANINFATDNQIIFDIDGTPQIELLDGILQPVTDVDINLGATDKRFQTLYGQQFHMDASIDGIGNNSYSGMSATLRVGDGAAVAAWDLVCISDVTNEVQVADADAVATSRVIGINPLNATISDNAEGVILFHGFVRNDAWGWTPGATLYLHTGGTGSTISATAPSGTDDCVVPIGVALEADMIYFNPSGTVIEHA